MAPPPPPTVFRPPLETKADVFCTSRMFPSLCCCCCISVVCWPLAPSFAAMASFYCMAHCRLRCSTIRLPFAGLASMNDALRLSFKGDGYGGLWMPLRPDFDWLALLVACEEVGGHRTEFCLTSQFIPPCIICEWGSLPPLLFMTGPPAE